MLLLLAVCISSSVWGEEVRVIELLVSSTGEQSGSGIVRFDALTGQFRGQLDDPDADPIPSTYDQPKGLAVDPSGGVYAAYRCASCDDTQRSAILRFSLAAGGRFTGSLAADRGIEQGFDGLALSPDGLDLYASQREIDLVQPYDAQSGNARSGITTFTGPRGLTYNSNGILFGLNRQNPLAKEGQIFGVSTGGKPFVFAPPDPFGPLALDDLSAGLAFSPDGDLFVVSTDRDTILRYRTERGEPLPRADAPDEFASPAQDGCVDPVGLAFGPHDQNLYVTCRTSNNVVRYDGLTGQFIDEFIPGGINGRLRNPTYLAFASYSLPSALRLGEPPNGADAVEPVTVFRWTRSDNPAVQSYRLIIANDPSMDAPLLELPNAGESIIAPQVAVSLKDELAINEGDILYWQVIGLDAAGDPIEQSQEVFSFVFFTDQRGFTVITGLVKSDLNQIGLAGARVAVSSAAHAGTSNSIVVTEFNGTFILVAVSTDNDRQPIPFPIEVSATKKGFHPATVLLQESEKQNGVISRDLPLRDDLPFSASLQLQTPSDQSQPEPTTIFGWTRSQNPVVRSYRLIIADDPDMENIVLNLPGAGDSIIAPQVAIQMGSELADFEAVPLYWRVIGQDQSGNPVEQGRQVFSFEFFTDERGFTVISGLVKSDHNQLGLAGARVALLGEHAQTANDIVQTAFNGTYIVIALTTGVTDDFDPKPIPFPISMAVSKEAYKASILVDIKASERKNGVITRNVTMIRDGDGDGIADSVENDSSCLDANDADTDDDGIVDGDEDTNQNGVKNRNELDPCNPDTDNDLIQDGTESGLTLKDIGPDTDRSIFRSDLDPSTTTNPLDPDTNHNGLPDGAEDKNRNGRVDAGESDPSLITNDALPAILHLLLGD